MVSKQPSFNSSPILPFNRERGGKNDICMACRRCSDAVMDDYCGRLRKGGCQAAKILMVVKWIPTGPVHKTYVRIAAIIAAIGKWLAWLQKQVGDPGNGDEVFDTIHALREAWQGHVQWLLPGGADGAQRVGKPSARLTKLPEHCRQNQCHPDRLFPQLALWSA